VNDKRKGDRIPEGQMESGVVPPFNEIQGGYPLAN